MINPWKARLDSRDDRGADVSPGRALARLVGGVANREGQNHPQGLLLSRRFQAGMMLKWRTAPPATGGSHTLARLPCAGCVLYPGAWSPLPPCTVGPNEHLDRLNAVDRINANPHRSRWTAPSKPGCTRRGRMT